MVQSPFKFLDSYTREDRAIFFGRDQEITDLYRRVFESKMLLVYGVSGTGKSSLINCGLASRFDDSDWLPVNVRRGSNIVDSLNEAFNKQAIRPFRKNLTVAEKLQSIYLDHFKPVYLIFDQFEELFIFGTQEEKTGFIKLIKAIVDSETQCRIIFVIREEFLAGITEFEYELPEIFSNRFRVEKMKRSNAISAIEGPCKVHNIVTEEGFSEELIDKLCPAGNDIELTFLQIYLDRIFRLTINEKPETGNITFSKEVLTRAGSVSDLLGQFLEEQIGEMDDPNSATSILKSFVSVQGTKRQMNEVEILESIGAFGIAISEVDLTNYLHKFVDLRILRERDETGHFELRHDALAAKIYEKFTITEKELLEVRLFVENAFQTFNTRKTWLSNDDLEYIASYERRMFLPRALEQFVRQSKDKIQSQQRALKRLTRFVAIVFIGLIGLGIRYYLNQKSTQQTREYTIFALLQEKVDPLTSIVTAFKARENDTLSPVIEGIILRSFFSLLDEKINAGDTSLPVNYQPVQIPVKDSISAMRINKSGSHIFGWTDGKEIILIDLKDSKVMTFTVPEPVLVVEMSDDAKYFAVVYKNSNGGVYTSEGNRIFDFQTKRNYLMNDRLVRFFPHGKYFMAAVKDNTAEIYDSTGAILFKLEGHTESVNSLDISPDGRFIVTASSDKNALIWNFNHKIKRFTPYDTITGHIDTVWSCEFNATGKFILTASADSVLRISDLNGFQRERFFVYSTNSQNRPSVFFTLSGSPGETKKDFIWADTSLKQDAYNKKIFNARFVSNDKAVISSNYSYEKSWANKPEGVLRTEVVYFGQSYNNYYLYDAYLVKAKRQYSDWHQQYNKSWKISPDRQLFAAVPDKEYSIVLTAADGYQLIRLRGAFPEFSYNGKYLYYIYNKALIKLPIDLEMIESVVLEKNLFGDPKNGEQVWLLL